MFAHNNPQVDYGLIALCNALMIQHNSEVKTITLITDQGTFDYLVKSKGEALVNRAFDNVLLHAPADETTQKKRFRDTQYANYDLPWFNRTRASAYDFSPYDETILIDTDYLICDRSLDAAWGSTSAYRINAKARTLLHNAVGLAEQRLEAFGIPLFWATCIYFRKCDEAKMLFDLVDVVRENYDYYQSLYRFPRKTFRNDYAFSIAIHILNGWVEGQVSSLPAGEILTSFDADDLIDVPAINELTFITEDPVEHWRYRPSRVKGVSTHVMNKFSIMRNADKILALYGGDQ